MKDTTTTEIHTGEIDPIEAYADRFFAETRKGELGKEGRRMTKTTGVFVPSKWAERWDFTTAGYLSHFVHYLGTQKRNDGYIWDDQERVEKKTGLTPRQQQRCLKVLKADGAVHAKRGPGNRWMIRPNLPLLMLFDDMPSWGEAVEKVVAEVGRDAQPERVEQIERSLRNVPTGDDETSAQSLQNVGTVATKDAHSGDETCPLNTVTPVIPKTLSAGAHARPEPETKRREEKDSENVNKSVAVLTDVRGMSLDVWTLKRIVSNLAEKHPRVPLLDACKRYRNKVASMSKPVGNHEAYLRGHFEREVVSVEAEGPHPHGADAPVFKASDQEVHPRPKIDFKEMQRLMAQGVPDAEAVARATIHSDEERKVTA